VIAGLAETTETQDWCVACGAGKEARPLEKNSWVQEAGREILQGKSLREFVDSLKDVGPQAWCVACGAGKSASPLGQLANPSDLPDDVIDALAKRLITAVRIG
jgi:hypothetical protein